MMGHAGMAATAVRYLRVGRPPTTAGPPLDRPARAARCGPYGRTSGPPVDAGGIPPRPGPLRDRRHRDRAPTDEAGPAGFACQSFTSLSLDPPLVAFMVARTSTTWPRIARARRLLRQRPGRGPGRAVPVVRGQRAARTSSPASPRRRARVTGSPRLTGAPAWIDCTVHTVHTGGDHLMVVGRVCARGRRRRKRGRRPGRPAALPPRRVRTGAGDRVAALAHRRRITRAISAATAHSAPAPYQTTSYEPNASRATPPEEGDERRAHLVRGQHPAEDDRAVLAVLLAAQGDRRRHRGHPVEAVEDDEEDHRRVHRVASSIGRNISDSPRSA